LKKAIFYNISFLFFALIFSVSVLGQSASDSSLVFPFSESQSGGMFMYTPSNISSVVNYDFINNQYFIQNKIGGLNVGKARTLSFKQYQQYKFNKSISEYWDLKSGERKGNQSSVFGLPKLFIPGQAFDRIFGGNSVDIRPQGSAELIFWIKG
jgi:cell surface protein SprA